ncbi:PAS domain S-box protein, partial [Chroococcidiopsis sp.]|uniref:PAS domain S-box protein n=1 Tax=Chroococcidiopsis sp. TaxID=3088168 RepID=UPI003F3FD625
LLTFDAKQLNWQWNIAQIQARNITDNVVELLLLQLKKLPEETRQILRLAACVGSEFDLDTLAIVCEKLPKAIFQNLLAAIHAGLIQPLSELDENLLVQEYKFLHDRVQQAAYALIDESQKQVVHLQIGRNLLEKTSLQQRSERLFEVVDHLNHGIELVIDRPQRNEIAKLNLMAGQKAKAATAYEAALQYFTTGLKLLHPESWQNQYDLTLALYSEAAEAAYLQGCFSEMEEFVEVVLNRAKTVLDKVQVYDSRIQSHLSQGNLKEALKIGLEVLRLLDITLIETPSQLDVQKGLEETATRLAEREIADLINLPKMTAPRPLAAIHILGSIVSTAFFVSPVLMILMICKMVNLSIDYGNAALSSQSYAAYGNILGGVVQDIELGYEFGKLALSLAERLNSKGGTAKALMVSAAFIMHWKVHLRETIPVHTDAYQDGVETGDFEVAGYAAYNACCYSFFIGEELNQLEQRTATYSEAIGQIRRENPSNWIAMLWQTILNLLGQSENPSRLIGSKYDEEQALSHAIAVEDKVEILYLCLSKVILCYLFGEYRQAVQSVVLAEQYFDQITAVSLLPLFCFYHSLLLLHRWIEASSVEQEAWLSRVSTHQEKMQKWAEHAPMNYLHKFYLVEAEKARVLGQFFEAEEFYELAIAGAAENEFIQEEALAYELAAKHYLARGRQKIAQTYMKEAHYCYDRWGAKAKVKDLENRYGQFFSQSSRVTATSIPPNSGTTSNTSHSALDLASVMKASLAISCEIELEQLLRSLMQVLIQNAGAQTGYLILENSGEWTIEASFELNDGENVCATRVLQSLPIANRLPETIINYVIRTHESVILNEATREGNFIQEPYIQQHQTKSIFCLPLLNQAKLVGVLYLENQLAVGAFTTERSQVLNLLSTQAAIAIENAFLYSKLQKSESKITQFLEAVPVGIAIVDATGRPYYANQRGIQLTGKATDPDVAPEQISAVYQFYEAGTERIYPTEKLPTIRALKGERTRSEDLEIRQNNTTIPVEAWGTPVYDERGNIAYAIVAFQDITQRKQAEKLLANYNRILEQQVVERTAALRQSEANYRNLIQTANSVILRTDTQGRIRYVNDCGLSFFGYEEEQILGRTLLETIVPETETSGRNLKQFVDNLFDNLEAPLPQAYLQTENENLCRDGRRVWIAWSNQAILDEQGQVVEILSVGNDITGRKQAQEALQRSETKFRNIFENSQVGIFRARLSDGLFLDANQRFANLFGFDSPDEVIGLLHAVDCYVNPSDRHKAVELLNRDGKLQNFEVQLRRRDGTLFWALYSARPNVADECMEGVIADISDRKRAEVALQTSEERLRLALTAANQGLYDLDLRTEERIVNPEYALMLGYDPATFHEPISEWIARLHPDDRESVVATYRAYIAGEIPSYQAEYRQRTQDGQWKWTLSVGKIVAWDELGQPTRMLGTHVDINDRKRAEEASILEERNRMAREIHDTLAQAFTGILIQVGAATQVLTDDPEATQTHLETIEELARIGLGEARRSVTALRPQLLESGNLSTALDRLVTLMRATTDTALIYQIQGTAYRLPAEVENNLLRIGQEALTNAIRYAEASEIRIELVYDDVQCSLRVKDNGQGFGVGSVPHIGGFGLLGMSERAERIGAQLRISSQPEQGTEIVVVVNS